jgi:hypothetical protein
MIARTIALLILLLSACSVTPRVSALTPKYVPEVTSPPGEPLAMLSWISGLSILGGIALLVVTSGVDIQTHPPNTHGEEKQMSAFLGTIWFMIIVGAAGFVAGMVFKKPFLKLITGGKYAG